MMTEFTYEICVGPTIRDVIPTEEFEPTIRDIDTTERRGPTIRDIQK